MQESIPVLKSEKVKREMLRGAELALGLPEGSMPVPFYVRPQLWWFLWTPWIKFGFPYSFPTPQIRKTADFSISDNGSSLWVQRKLERGVGETPPEKGAACCWRKSIAILSGIWLLQMQSFTLPTSKELKTDWKVLCTRLRNNNDDLWTCVYESKNVPSCWFGCHLAIWYYQENPKFLLLPIFLEHDREKMKLCNGTLLRRRPLLS